MRTHNLSPALHVPRHRSRRSDSYPAEKCPGPIQQIVRIAQTCLVQNRPDHHRIWVDHQTDNVGESPDSSPRRSRALDSQEIPFASARLDHPLIVDIIPQPSNLVGYFSCHQPHDPNKPECPVHPFARVAPGMVSAGRL